MVSVGLPVSESLDSLGHRLGCLRTPFTTAQGLVDRPGPRGVLKNLPPATKRSSPLIVPSCCPKGSAT